MTTIRQTFRRLARRPGFALSFSLPLALALAGAGVMLTLVRGVLVDPLPFSEPHRLLQISERNLEKGGERGRVAVADFYDMKRLESFESVAGYLPPWRMPMSGSGGVTKVRTGNGTYNLLDTLGVAPVAGRLYTAADESGDARIVVVTTGFAIELAGSANAAVGRTIVLQDQAYEIVGVIDPRMTLPVAELDVLVPIRHSESMKANRKSHVLLVVGRLASGTSAATAQAELDVLLDGIRRAHPDEKAGEEAILTPLHDEVVGEVRRPLLILLAAIGILLLIAVTNVSGIAVARARSRAGELAVRQSLGASALRAWFPVALEAMVLSIAAGGVAAMAAIAGVRFAVAATADWVPRVRHVEPGPIDGALVIAFALVAGLIVSTVTAFVAARPAGASVLRGAGWSGVAVTRDRLRASIVVAQVALSFVLLAGSAVLVRSMVDLLTTDPGYRTRDVLTVDLELPSGRYESVASQTAAFRRVVDSVGALPGVESAAATSSGPVSGARITRSFFLEEPDAAGRRSDYPYLAITPGYFATMGIPLVRGRAFDERDTAEAPLVLIVNEAFARRESPDGDLLGKRISFAGAEGPWIEVVGIAADTRHEGVDTEPEPQLYVPDTQRTWTWLDWTTLVVRVEGDPAAVAASMRSAIRAVEPEIPVDGVATLEQQIADALAKRRFQLFLVSSFALLAVALTAIGMFALMRNALMMRSREVGVRLALGAEPADVVRLFAREGIALVAAGLGIGLAISAAALRFLESMVVRTSPNDPTAVTAAVLLILAVTALSCYLPSRRAARVDPAVVLKSE